MLTPYSQTEKATRDTIIRKATGAQLTRVASMYGLQLPHSGYPEKSIRQALHAASFNARGTMGATLGFIEGILQHLQVRLTGTYHGVFDGGHNGFSLQLPPDASDEAKLAFSENHQLLEEHVGSWVRIQDPAKYPDDPAPKLFKIRNVVRKENNLWTAIEFENVATAYWDSPTSSDSSGVTEIALLPFYYTEPTIGPVEKIQKEKMKAGLAKSIDLPCKVVLYGHAWSAINVPPTYLEDYALPPNVSGDTQRFPGTPYGGALMENAGVDGSGQDKSASPNPHPPGPFPIYFGAGETIQFLIQNSVEPFLVAGVDIIPGYTFEWDEKSQKWSENIIEMWEEFWDGTFGNLDIPAGDPDPFGDPI